MRIIKGFQNTYNIFHDLCRGTDNSLLILYGHIEKVQPGVAVIHRDRSENSYNNLKVLEQEIIEILNEITGWNMFDNIFLHGNFEEDEIRILNRIDNRFQERFNLTITVQVWDSNLENKWIIEKI